MRLILTPVFILLILVHPFIHTLIYVKFRVNQDYIAKTLCEKKDVKGNTCHGCCQLKKQLKKTDEQPLKEVPKSRTIKIDISYCNYFHIIEQQARYPLNLNRGFNSFNSGFLSSDYINSIFHPPKQA